MKTSQWALFKRLIGYLKRYKGLTFLSILFLVAFTVTESVIPLVARYYIDAYITTNQITSGLWVIAGYYIIYLMHIVLGYVGTLLFAKISYGVVRDMRQDVFDNVQRLGMRYFDQSANGTVVSRITNDTETVAVMFNGLLTNMIRAIFLFSATLYTMIWLDAKLTAIIVLFLPVIMLSMTMYRRLSAPIIMNTRAKLGELNAKLSESIEGMRVIQAFNQEERIFDEFDRLNEEHLVSANRSINIDSIFLRPAMSLLQLLAYALLATYFGLTFKDAGLTAGLMYAFIQYVNRLFNPLIQVTQDFATLQTSMVSASRVFDLIDEDVYEPEQLNATHAAIENGDVVFEHVSFSYDGVNNVLNDISFTVKKGETIAFVGHTGSGKSSIINVLMRFYEFSKGSVTIDGVNIKEYPQQVIRDNIGLVLQEPFLFHGTIADNIQMYQHLTRQQVIDAAKFVDADEFISKLDNGYDAPVAERGSTLSSGQRQLIAFARTIALNPKVLILDEATANIDSETEEMIQRSLHKMRQGRTTIAIAHRLSTIQDANCIYVLDKGRIVEQGTHEELLALQGQYYDMYRLQSGKA
ncbi:ABC transporter ATP-binding protein [Carnobacteriaceae bacterium zg-ZUI252]|nr:ABC transporter ATP-binding protein [Carnobacteriaceae bacterium zg-ZUI252]MBS4770187.1 ABC transporter ATP-binding protein [Carnobacteriaceae bacterium zg-ZUI240]